ncbi:phosphoethanolamine transferase [Aureibaculum conchae]|uniref:phosphoethanolamine transferase n=1 Tax=Aureibaculum sp. 2308TA14-22 TaxID=3108392 RepID=UPI00339392CA
MIELKKSIIQLKEIFKKYLLLLVAVPVLLGYIINFDASNKLELLIRILWIPIFYLPYFFFKKKIFHTLMIVFYFIVGIIEIGHWLMLKGPVSLASLFMIANSNFNETTEFLSVQSSFLLLLLIPYAALFILALKEKPRINNGIFKLLLSMNVILGISSFLYMSLSAFIAETTPLVIRNSYVFMSDFRKYSKAVKNNKLKEIDASQTHTSDQQLFVLIIGESASKNHMSLYGYPRKTNPKLELRDDLYVFDDVVSAYSNTIAGVMSLITESNLNNKLQYYESKDIIDVFHSLGFETYWISNQTPFGWAENLISATGSKTDHTTFVNLINNSTYEGNKNISYDEKLLAPFIDALNEKVDKKMIVLHMMGNHLSYDKRYPKPFSVFEGTDYKSQLIAEYDNSIVYNDYVLDSIFSLIKNNTVEKNRIVASAIYVSDHGENIYDEDDMFGHHFVNHLPKVNVEIPMLVWLSPTYKTLDSVKHSLIKNRINTPYVSDDTFHTILDLNHIKSPVFDKTRSLFHKDFNQNRLRILIDGKDYDKKIKMP